MRMDQCLLLSNFFFECIPYKKNEHLPNLTFFCRICNTLKWYDKNSSPLGNFLIKFCNDMIDDLLVSPVLCGQPLAPLVDIGKYFI